MIESNALERVGLTRNEAKTYLALLALGTSASGAILKESKLNSGKIYEILESLKQKGLASEIIENGKRKFTAAPPQQLNHFLEQKRTMVADQEAYVQKILPQLEAIHAERQPAKQIVTYTGFRGIMTAAEEALAHTKTGEEILSLGISDVNAWSQTFWVKWEKQRARKRITARYVLSEQGSIYNDLKGEVGVAVRILPLETPVGIDVYGTDTVLILHYQEPVSCTLIMDEHTARTFRAYFEVVWQQARTPKRGVRS